VAFGYVLGGVHDLDVLPDEAVGYPLPAVDACPLHDDAVLDLRVEDGGAVSDAGVGTDVGVGLITQLRPMMAGPRMVVLSWITVPSPIPTRLLMVADLSTFPWL